MIGELISHDYSFKKEENIIEPIILPETIIGVYDYVAKTYTVKNNLKFLPELGYTVRVYYIFSCN